MDTSPRLYFRYVCCLLVVCCKICRGYLIATTVTGYGGDTTVFTCSSPDISPGNSYVLRKDGIAIYRSINEGITVGGKYSAAAEVGKINLKILNTKIEDAGEYSCNHNFIDAFGTVSVAFQPKKVTATTSQQEHMWRLSVSAFKVFPREANISDVSCLRPPDNPVAVFQRENQEVNTNNEEQFLYDIFWNGTIARTWSGDVECNITIVVIDTIVRTVNVSFQESDSTSEPFPVWQVWHIMGGIFISIGMAIVIVFVICYSRKKALYPNTSKEKSRQTPNMDDVEAQKQKEKGKEEEKRGKRLKRSKSFRRNSIYKHMGHIYTG